MGYPVHKATDLAGEVRVPGMGVQDVDTRRGLHHVEIDPEHLECGVGSLEEAGHLMCHGVWARGTEAVHVDLGQVPELGHQLVDVNPGAAVNLRWPFAGQHSDAHA